MMSPQEFAAAWGEDRYRFSPDILESVDIPEAAKAFLVEAGLPLRPEVPLGSYVVPLPLVPASPPFQAANRPLLSRYQSAPFRLLAYFHSSWWLGDEHALYYAIEEGTGRIYWVGPGIGDEAGRFVNASLPQFVEFLLSYRELVTRFQLMEAEMAPARAQVKPLLRPLKKQWQGIDSMALADPDNYWVMAYYDIMECF